MSEPSDRPTNFSAGPAILPLPVFERCAAAVERLDRLPSDSRKILDLSALEARLSILEISHRSKTFDAIHEHAIELCHEVLQIPRTHKVLFLQGGASLQFCMVPMNLRRSDRFAGYVDTGSWSSKAIAESRPLGETKVLASSKSSGYDHIPELPTGADYAWASYVHITTNNTIYGTEWETLPALEGGVPLVADMSSNIGSRPMAMEHVALGYAGAQKNLGPSGLTLVFIRESLLEQEAVAHVPTMLRYRTHAEKNSLFNTPNTFGVLVLREVLMWVAEQGGVEALGKINEGKAQALYSVLDGSSLYRPHAKEGSRSRMNVTWTLEASSDDQRETLTKRFLAGAEKAGLSGLKGHRSVGGCRASIYNALPREGVDALCEFMREFERSQA